MKNSKVSITKRIDENSSLVLPIRARSVGWHKIDNGWHCRLRIKNNFQLFWGVSGSGTVRSRNENVELKKDELLIYVPGNEFYIEASNGPWEFRWITMDGQRCAEILEDFGLTGPWPKVAGVCPEALFDALEVEIHNTLPRAEYSASATLYQLLSIISSHLHTGESKENQNQLVERCLALMYKTYMNQINVSSLASQLEVHRSRLSREFRASVGSSPQQYLHSLRLQKAALLLKETNMSIKEIAYATGFSSPAHFGKCFKDSYHQTPNSFRIFPES
jgi:AraC-like DNA-binding protein